MSPDGTQFRASVLVVHDNHEVLQWLDSILSAVYDVHLTAEENEAQHILQSEWIQVILYDESAIDNDGTELLNRVASDYPEIVTMIMAEQENLDTILRSVKQCNVHEYITKPWHEHNLLHSLQKAIELFHLRRENQQLAVELKLKPNTIDQAMVAKRQALQSRFSWDSGIIRGPASPMNDICNTIRNVAAYDINVLLTGESGTGKELCARSLHFNSLRQDAPFIAENCGALPDELLESELFGHKKGAFTGAIEERIGLFEQADGGTIFLDEIGETSPAFQVKLLRVIQEGEIRPLGSNIKKPVNVRVVAATNQNLEEMVRNGTFRQDLYYRLATISVAIPPLRKRREDIAVIAVALLNKTMEQMGKKILGISQEVLDCFFDYEWPGNVRELQNEIKRMLVLCQSDYIESHLISPHILHTTPNNDQPELDFLTATEGSLKERLSMLESVLVKETLIRHRWNKTQAAKDLGLSRVGLNNKIERYSLEHNTQLENIEDLS